MDQRHLMKCMVSSVKNKSILSVLSAEQQVRLHFSIYLSIYVTNQPNKHTQHVITSNWVWETLSFILFLSPKQPYMALLPVLLVFLL